VKYFLLSKINKFINMPVLYSSMVIQGKKFKGVVEFESDRDNYDGVITMYDNWVFIDNEEYIPHHKVSSVTCVDINTMETQ